MLRQAAPYLVGLAAGLLASGLLYLLLSPPYGQPIRLDPAPSPAPIRVHVSGAVARPGVVTLPPGSIVADAIQAAGEVTAAGRADSLNLAARLKDGEQVYVPGDSETAEFVVATQPTPDRVYTGQIPINSASVAELELLPGIGPSLAQAIVGYRQAHGSFETVDELTEVPGIGPAKLAAIRDLVVCR